MVGFVFGLAHEIGAQVVVEKGRTVLHRVEHPGHARQHFVIDLDLRRGFFGEMDVRRGDGRHGVAPVKSLALGQAVGRHVSQVDFPCLAHDGELFVQVGEIGGGDDGEHAGNRQRLSHVDRLDLRMGVGAADDLAMRHVRQLHVGRVDRLAGHLVGTVVPDGARAENLVFRSGPR